MWANDWENLEVGIMERVEADNWKERALGRTWLRILKSPVVIKEQFAKSYYESEAKIFKKLREEMSSQPKTAARSVGKELSDEKRWSSNPTAGHTHWGNQKGKRLVYPSVHHSTIYNSQDMEATNISFTTSVQMSTWFLTERSDSYRNHGNSDLSIS